MEILLTVTWEAQASLPHLVPRSTMLSSRWVYRSARRLGAVAARHAFRHQVQATGRFLPQSPVVFYSTERIVELRSGRKNLPTLYDATRETENCGVGLIASLKSVPSRKIVEQADEMLVRMAHRGGCGCDPASGDGSGT